MALSRRAFVQRVGVGGAGMALVGHPGARLLADVGQQSAAPPFIGIGNNENPRGPSPAALEALRSGATPGVGRYPNNSAELRDTIARMLGGSEENVLLATGSGSELIAAARAYTGPTKFLVNGSPSFPTAERTAAEIMQAPIELVPVTADLELDLDAMAEAARGAGLVFVCNPNNPTGTAHSAEAIGELVARVKASSPSTAILIDEAYIDYAIDLPLPTAARYALEYPDVFITRTFSKAYGMAGLRLGYAFGQPGTLAKLRDAWGLGSVNALSAAGAIAALNDTAHLESERRENARIREYTLNAFKALGYDAPRSNTNFIFVNTGRPITWFREACAQHNVKVGVLDFPPMDQTHCRISIGLLEEMQRAMEVFEQVLGSRA